MRLCEYTDEQLTRLAADHRRLANWPTTMTELFVRTQLAAAAAIEELLDRRAADQTDHRAMERSLAYTLATSLIEINTVLKISDDLHATWFDLQTIAGQTLGGFEVQDIVGYLDTRGLIERNPANPNQIQLRDESEATA